MLMEYVDAPEITVDLFADKGEVVLPPDPHARGVPHRPRDGVQDRSTGRSSSSSRARSSARLELDYYQSVQWIGGRLLEINPRVSTFVYQEDFIIPYLGIKYALGELTGDDVAAVQARVRTSRRSVRYYDQVFWDE